MRNQTWVHGDGRHRRQIASVLPLLQSQERRVQFFDLYLKICASNVAANDSAH